MTRRTARAGAASALGALCLASLQGCGADPDEPSVGGVSSTTSGGATSEPTDDASDGADVEPATGEEIVTPHLSVRAPEGWRVQQLSDSLWVSVPRPLDGSSMTVGDLEVPGDPESLDFLAREALRNESAGAGESRPDILDPVEIGGVEVYHVGGRTNSGIWFDGYGPSVEGAIVNISFRVPTYAVSRVEREALIESVLATVEWNL